ncbi:hypothetical protein [Vibrio parahaemolyticus]|uniref:hypothetical protein n=1 Tax=Vibrio parahaemolyticus TaxID=670 RepID=UPI00047167CD|nr:hypothetical protein [Vibrio parahaemolyticus]
MQVLDDIWSSIKGNAKTRVKDPVIGAFVVSWCFCNWDKLALLFWGTDKVDQRIAELTNSMSVITKPSLLWTDLDLVIIPGILALTYLFALPWLSLWVKKKQDTAVLSQHTHAIDLDIKQANEQKELNKAVLRANPEKEFLAEEIKLDQQREKERLERRNKIKEYIDQKAKAAKADADAKSVQAEKERLDLESKKRQDDSEKLRFNAQTAVHKATMASSRFPAAYQLMDMLSQSLRENDIVLSLDGLSNTVATLFGYSDAKEMMDDESFSNEGLNEIKYLYHDSSFLAKRLDQIVKSEESDNEDLSGEILFEHLQGILENYPFELLSDESLAERISESVNENSYDILGSDELSGPMAETDTIFEEIYLEVDNFNFDTAFEVKMSGYASGHHRNEADMMGRDLSVQVVATCKPTVGKFGLSDYQLEIGGSPRDYGDDAYSSSRNVHVSISP